MRKTNQKGFTIIELLVVIVIIGILVALALPQLFAAQARGRDTDRKNDLKNLQQKLETYFNDNDKYPLSGAEAAAEALNIDVAEFTGPRDTAYTYEATDCDTEGCQAYTLSTNLENKSDASATDKETGLYEVKSVNQVQASEDED